jgi:hypothetical protein
MRMDFERLKDATGGPYEKPVSAIQRRGVMRKIDERRLKEFCDKSLAQDQGAGHQVFRSLRDKVVV